MSAPEDEHDDRPLVSDLLEKYSDQIKHVREVIETDRFYVADKYDNLWILRFVLSHKGSKTKAAKVALKTMEFRNQYKLNEIGNLNYTLMNEPKEDEHEIIKVCRRYYECFGEVGIIATLPDSNRGIVKFTEPAELDTKGVIAEFTEEDFVLLSIATSENFQQTLDFVTRKTGRLTKLLNIMDNSGMKLKDVNMALLKRDSRCSKITEDFYPQLLGSVFVVHAPSWVSMIWKVTKPLLPRRTVEKIDFISSKESGNFERFSRYISKSNLPKRFGGENETHPPTLKDVFGEDPHIFESV